jgi:bacteriorhodopsin
MNSEMILWITAVVMLLGGLAILALGKRRTEVEFLQTVVHGTVPIIAACLYFAMATGQGRVDMPDAGSTGSHIFYWGRYVDWSFTTPLLLLSLGVTAMHSGRKQVALLAGAAIADVMMILTAFAFSASEVPWMKWTWFLISCVAFLGVYWVIWIGQLQANASEREDVRSAYRKNATILSVLWFLYPIVLALAPDGLHVLSDLGAVLVIAILDVLAKVVYGLIATDSDAKITDRDLAEGTNVGRAETVRAV